MLRRKEEGFTLIELLIVIVIIGILAGVVVTVIDPANQQRRARETVLRATVEKACTALHACGSQTTDARNCDTWAEAGIRSGIAGTPVGSAYYLNDDGTSDAGTQGVAPETGQAGAAGDTLYFRGTYATGSEICRFQCGFNFSTGSPIYYAAGPIMEIPAGDADDRCLVGVQ